MRIYNLVKFQFLKQLSPLLRVSYEFPATWNLVPKTSQLKDGKMCENMTDDNYLNEYLFDNSHPV